MKRIILSLLMSLNLCSVPAFGMEQEQEQKVPLVNCDGDPFPLFYDLMKYVVSYFLVDTRSPKSFVKSCLPLACTNKGLYSYFGIALRVKETDEQLMIHIVKTGDKGLLDFVGRFVKPENS